MKKFFKFYTKLIIFDKQVYLLYNYYKEESLSQPIVYLFRHHILAGTNKLKYNERCIQNHAEEVVCEFMV